MNFKLATFLRKTLIPFILISLCTPGIILIWHTHVALDGSLAKLIQYIMTHGFFKTLYEVWSPIFFGNTIAWSMISIFSLLQLLFMKYLPGKMVSGPRTSQGNIPNYKANGVLAFSLTLLVFYSGAYFFNFFSATIIYDHFGPLLSALNLSSFLFCILLFIKGHLAPSSNDSGTTGNPLFDFFWGMELYPRILGFDVKQFTNCRFGMMSWALIIISFAAKQSQIYGLSSSMFVAVALQLLYIGKFFLWETGYLCSMDITNDRAGYMICWGCLVWVPCVYTSSTLYLVDHPNTLSPFLTGVLLGVGAFGIIATYLADRQRQQVRLTNGNCLIWGKKPEIITAEYTTNLGKIHQTPLLASGWWGIARHFHYITELTGTLCWTIPALNINLLPYFYFIFLTALLIDRAFRHERRCQKKYKSAWDRYCVKVPYKFIPYIY